MFVYLGNIEFYVALKIIQILVELTTNFSNLYLALLLRLETSSKPFHDFDKVIT